MDASRLSRRLQEELGHLVGALLFLRDPPGSPSSIRLVAGVDCCCGWRGRPVDQVVSCLRNYGGPALRRGLILLASSCSSSLFSTVANATSMSRWYLPDSYMSIR
jgi:hypothetical protein